MNTFGFCNLSAVPCRKEASDKSEMVTQFLFGEFFEILEEYKSWLLVRSGIDKYEGWMDRKQFLPVSEETYRYLKSDIPSCTADVVGVMQNVSTGTSFPVTQGCLLHSVSKSNEFTIEKSTFRYQGNVANPLGKIVRADLVEDAFTYLNAPYLWGGRTPLGIDCSGFTQMVYRLSGLLLPRDAYQQAELGETLSFPEEAKAGDLAFFDNNEGRITHTGIVLDNFQVIHASGMVRIDNFDHLGIYNKEKNGYTHNLRILKKMF
jgi:gamma-D-glutamyl-L-lysine dipeptidyl-peptidase